MDVGFSVDNNEREGFACRIHETETDHAMNDIKFSKMGKVYDGNHRLKSQKERHLGR